MELPKEILRKLGIAAAGTGLLVAAYVTSESETTASVCEEIGVGVEEILDRVSTEIGGLMRLAPFRTHDPCPGCGMG